jgi:Nucleotidyl transferase AbiEii toxin, Type IV TA system
LGCGDPSHERVRAIFVELCGMDSDDDGLVFDSNSIRLDEIKPEDVYDGVRVRLQAFLGKAQIGLQIDVGFGDAVVPEPVKVLFPSLLKDEEPEVVVYPRESVIAEKFQTMVLLDEQNSRMKDFFDLYILSEKFEFQGGLLKRAVVATFARRETEIPTELPIALDEAFVGLKASLWSAFLRKSAPAEGKLELAQVIAKIKAFIWPVCLSIVDGGALGEWEAGGPWSESAEGTD